MGQLLRFPAPSANLDRLVERDRAENIATERAGAVKIARSVLRSPETFSDTILRDACAALQAWGDGTDYLTADAMIFALNKRERERAHEEARRAIETPAQVAARHWQPVAAMGLGVALAVLVVALIGGRW